MSCFSNWSRYKPWMLLDIEKHFNGIFKGKWIWMNTFPGSPAIWHPLVHMPCSVVNKLLSSACQRPQQSRSVEKVLFFLAAHAQSLRTFQRGETCARRNTIIKTNTKWNKLVPDFINNSVWINSLEESWCDTVPDFCERRILKCVYFAEKWM